MPLPESISEAVWLPGSSPKGRSGMLVESFPIGSPSFSNAAPVSPIGALVSVELLLRLRLLLNSKRTTAATTANTAMLIPTPMPAFAPPLRDELLLFSTLATEVGEVPPEVIAEALVPVDDDDDAVAVGIKSTIDLVLSLSSSGAGASNVWLTEVEHAVPGWQHAHDLLLAL